MSMSRRQFLGSSAAAITVAGTMATGKVFGANERINACVVGVNGRGGWHISELQNRDDVEVVALIDADERILQNRARVFEREYGRAPDTYVDMRDAYAREDIDVVGIATPNHWHTLASIWALQAGKDVYVEKPLSHDVWEGRQLIKWTEKTGQICMHGTQNRSSSRWLRDIKLMHEGFIGKIHLAKGYTYKTGNRQSIGYADVEEPPSYLDWSLWQGPANEQPYRSVYHPYNWHWFWEYGNGETGNQGVHEMDICVWGMNRGMPEQVYSSGGRHVWDDMGETPNVQTSTFTYADGSMLIFEIRNTGSWEEGGATTAAHFLGADGYYLEGKGFFDYNHKPIEVPADVESPASEGPYGNFLKAVRTRDKSFIRGTVEEGHESCVHCHIANVAYRVGRSLKFDGANEAFIADEEANKMLKHSADRPGFEIPVV